MGRLYDELKRELGPGMVIPEALTKLYEWIEERVLYRDGWGEAKPPFKVAASHIRVGFLFPPAEHRTGWIRKRRIGGTQISFSARGRKGLDYWFGFRDKRTGDDISGGKGDEILKKLCIFATTGGEGSMAALWLGDDGVQRIVHLGSGSGSTMVCVLTEDPVDFLRLLAIGYDEICWDHQFSDLPNARLS
ncbi:MAG TPA: hypothetical protein VHM90_19630, partial [Phycisphaerae bacterium]|nr:hypothetical protein [Phycisphaerae bacterium]